MQKFSKLGMGAVLSAALVLAPMASVSANFMSMKDEDMQRYQSMFRVTANAEEGSDPILDNGPDEDNVSDRDGEISNPGDRNNPSQVSEPGMLALFGIGALGLALMVRRRTQIQASA